MKRLVVLVLMLGGGSAVLSFAQSTGTITQTVNQRNTIGTLTANPSGNVTAGNPVSFTYTLNTAGAPAPTTETVQFYDSGTAIGSAQTIGLGAGSNLIPYSQVNTSHGWTTTGTAPTVTPLAVNGPDGSTSTASTLSFANGTSTVLYAVPSSTNYASQQMTFSIWAASATPTTLNLIVQDSPHVNASQSAPCAVTSTWQRCSLTYTFPANAGTGFAVSLTASNYATPINVWGAQFEQAAQSGPYVSTIGTARPTGGQAGTVTFSYSNFHTGSHTVTVQYAGDTNFVGSTSNAVALTASKEVPGMTLTDSPVGTSVYGVSVTLTVQLSDQDNSDGWIPSGTVQFFDGATSLGTANVDGTGKATVTLVGATSLAVGSHSLTAQYSGDSQFSSLTSGTVTHAVTKANSASVVTTTVNSSLNPSVYGDTVTLSINVSSSVGIQPTGTVTVMDGTTSLGTLTLDASGNASITVPVFTAGTHTIVVTYSGDSNYQ
jgi:Bacterial Ig-like domain (group 3)